MIESIKDQYINQLKNDEAGWNGHASEAFYARKKQAIADFKLLDLPTIKDEEWKYTNLSKLFKQLTPKTENRKFTKDLQLSKDFGDVHLVVLENGQLNTSLSDHTLGDKVFIGSLKNSWTKFPDLYNKYFAQSENILNHALYTLNTASDIDGVFISISDGVILDKPLHILHLTNEEVKENIIQVRHLTILGKNAQACIIETFHDINAGLHCYNYGHEIFVDEYAILDNYKLQNLGSHSSLVDSTMLKQERGSVANIYTFSNGGGVIRNDLNVQLNNQHIESNIYGLSCGAKTNHIDHHTLMDHKYANCLSNELYKGIYKHYSRGVFNGKVYVRKDAQKTNAFQSNQNLLLSDNARVDTKPQLEIFADDVKCTHGATVGQLEDDSVFYMQSRGLDKEIARGILSYAFASEVVEKVRHKALNTYLRRQVLDFLELDLD